MSEVGIGILVMIILVLIVQFSDFFFNLFGFLAAIFVALVLAYFIGKVTIGVFT